MLRYVVRRVLFSLVVLFGVSLLVFSMVRLIPGDVAAVILADSQARPEDLARVRTMLGLDKPIHEQYVVWLGRALQGDLGRSIFTGRPVLFELWQRLPVSLELAVLATLVATAIAIPAGIISAVRQDSPVDWLVRLLAILGLSIPGFWLGTLMIVLPSVWFGYVPPVGYTPVLRDPWRNLQQFIFPALALGAFLAGSLTRMTRSQMLEVLRQDYIRTARSKGLAERVVVTRHALKNAFIPVLTVMGVQFGTILGGTVITETIFNLPGIGTLTLSAVGQRDYPQLQANILFLATTYVIINLAVDILYAWLDPRIRYE
jgi:peptide/nickel transport system permease protein